MSTKKWILNDNAIISNLKSIFKHNDINKMTLNTYRFIMNLSGFIAHYNIDGFKSNYNNVNDLLNDLLNSNDLKKPEYYSNDSYFSKHEQCEYYAKKTKILIAFNELCEQYKNKLHDNETELISDKWDFLQAIAKNDFNDNEKKNILLKFNLL